MELDPVSYGCWPSPVTAQMLTTADLRFAEICVDGSTCWWSENRPEESGRTQLVRRNEEGLRADVLPGGFNARTMVHEYGGGAWTVDAGTVVFSNFADQRIYRLHDGATEPVAISPVPSTERGWRYGDLSIVSGPGWGGSRWVLAVRESHETDVLTGHGEPVNEIVAVPLDGSAVHNPDQVVVLVTGPDFVASPCAYDGRLAWVQWNHPNMPFDNTSLLVADVIEDGGVLGLGSQQLVRGGTDDVPESVMQPRWSDSGELWFISDRSNWWNLYRWDGREEQHVAPVDAELGNPPWPLGKRDYDFFPDGRIVSVINSNGQGGLAIIDPSQPDQPPQPVHCGLTAVQQVAALASGEVLTVAGGPTLAFTAALVSLDGEVTALRDSGEGDLGAAWWAIGEPMAYASAGGRIARAVFYAPRNPDVRPPDDALPPLVVILHGGPTGKTDTALRHSVQYWTTRGFAVADLDYTGSAGYGRDYRRALYGKWGVADVEDCLAIVRHLAAEGRIDGRRTAIRGGSAGGFTTLAALTNPDNTFATGASYYGVADLMALVQDTHKFESRYLDQLVGPLPEAAQVYRERSPITHIERLAVPVVLFQGAEDRVVPPEQSRMIARALKENGLDCEYVEFEGEQHGFRKSETIVRAAGIELAFYRRVFGLQDV